jgi:adsorption protein B
MDVGGPVFAAVEFAMREAALLAATGFLLLGIGDLAVDLIWIGRTAWRRLVIYRRTDRLTADALAPAERPGRMAVFVPAWHEADVIGDMLTNALARFGAGDFLIYVGCYPNDPETIAAVRAIADPRVRLVIGPAL